MIQALQSGITYFRSFKPKRTPEGLDLAYIPYRSEDDNRIIAMCLPTDGGILNALLRNDAKKVSEFMKANHRNKYVIYNLTEKPHKDTIYEFFEHRVRHMPMADHQPPTFEQIYAFCIDAEAALQEPDSAIAIHCKAGKGRTGTMICCYLLWSRAYPDPTSANKVYSENRSAPIAKSVIVNGVKQTVLIYRGVDQASQVRWIEYFHQLLTEYDAQSTVGGTLDQFLQDDAAVSGANDASAASAASGAKAASAASAPQAAPVVAGNEADSDPCPVFLPPQEPIQLQSVGGRLTVVAQPSSPSASAGGRAPPLPAKSPTAQAEQPVMSRRASDLHHSSSAPLLLSLAPASQGELREWKGVVPRMPFSYIRRLRLMERTLERVSIFNLPPQFASPHIVIREWGVEKTGGGRAKYADRQFTTQKRYPLPTYIFTLHCPSIGETKLELHSGDKLVCRVWYHPYFVPENGVLRLTKTKIDDAWDSDKFSPEFAVELKFRAPTQVPPNPVSDEEIIKAQFVTHPSVLHPQPQAHAVLHHSSSSRALPADYASPAATADANYHATPASPAASSHTASHVSPASPTASSQVISHAAPASPAASSHKAAPPAAGSPYVTPLASPITTTLPQYQNHFAAPLPSPPRLVPKPSPLSSPVPLASPILPSADDRGHTRPSNSPLH